MNHAETHAAALLASFDLATDESAAVGFTTADGTAYTLKLRCVLDDTSGIGRWNSGEHHDDLYGRLCWPGPNYRNAYGYQHRPDGFDGAACKLTTRDGMVWWQPPADADAAQVAWIRARVQSYFHDEWTHVGLVVTCSKVCPCCSVESEVARDALYGIESDADGAYLQSIVAEMVGETMPE